MEESAGVDADNGAKSGDPGGGETFGQGPVGVETLAAHWIQPGDEGWVSRWFALERMARRMAR